MKTPNETDSLQESIIATQKLRGYQQELLKEQFHAACESIKPINLIKSTFRDMTKSPDIKKDVISSAVGLGTGFLSKKLFVGKSHSFVKKGIGTVIEFAIANLVSKNTDGIKAVGSTLLQRILKPSKN